MNTTNLPFDKNPEFYKKDNRRFRYQNRITKEFLEKKHSTILPEWRIYNKTILDIGSCLGATGQWCLFYGAKSYTGVEIQKRYCDISRQILSHHKSKVNIFNMSFEEFLKNNNKTYDIVVLAGILFVLINPYELLKKVSLICNKYIVIDNHYPKLIVDNKIDKNASIIEITESQGVNLSTKNKSLIGTGSRISPSALKILMKTLGFISKEGVLKMPPLTKGKDNYNNIQLEIARYLIVFEKTSILKNTLSEELGEKERASHTIKEKIINNSFFNNKIGNIIKYKLGIENPYNGLWDDKYKKYNDNKQIKKWSFNKTVANNFEQIAIKNIPDYKLVINKSIKIIKDRFIDKNLKIIDIGSAIGYTLKMLENNGYTNLIGIDNSKEMIKKSYKSKCVELILTEDLPKDKDPYEVIIANWTLHFTSNRRQYLSNIYNALSDKGIFILSEKTQQDKYTKKEYYDFKKKQGMSENEIINKEKLLEGILITYPIEWYLNTLKEIGFKNISIINYKYGFVSILAEK